MPTSEMQAEMRIVAEVTAKPGRAEALRAVLVAMIPPSVAEAGCRQYELHEDRDEPGRFVFVERWADAAAFEFHCRTPHFRQLGPAIAELTVAPPKLSKLRVIG
jgi:quinol monooxygenase YgiN